MSQERRKSNLNSLIFLDNKSPPICSLGSQTLLSCCVFTLWGRNYNLITAVVKFNGCSLLRSEPEKFQHTSIRASRVAIIQRSFSLYERNDTRPRHMATASRAHSLFYFHFNCLFLSLSSITINWRSEATTGCAATLLMQSQLPHREGKNNSFELQTAVSDRAENRLFHHQLRQKASAGVFTSHWSTKCSGNTISQSLFCAVLISV